jgi:hypothetical protein
MKGVRSRAEANYFSSSVCVQTSYEAYLASYPMDTGDHFTEGKERLVCDADHSPNLVSRSRMGRSYTALPLSACMV